MKIQEYDMILEAEFSFPTALITGIAAGYFPRRFRSFLSKPFEPAAAGRLYNPRPTAGVP